MNTYKEECARIEENRRSGLFPKLQKVGFCALRKYPGKDEAWRGVKALEKRLAELDMNAL